MQGVVIGKVWLMAMIAIPAVLLMTGLLLGCLWLVRKVFSLQQHES